MKTKIRQENDDLRPEYTIDYSKAVRGKYYRQAMEAANAVFLEPDVARIFRSSAAVNEALRSLLMMAAETQRLTARTRERSAKKRKNVAAPRR